jgi:hypothetical protein
MRGILADINVRRHWDELFSRLMSDQWRDLWLRLNLQVETFPSLGLPLTAPDSVIWQVCQQQQLILITDNRNANDPDSLEATIRAHNTPTSLPVFTVADAARVLKNKPYAEQVAEKLLEYLLDIDNLRGTGRLYLP